MVIGCTRRSSGAPAASKRLSKRLASVFEGTGLLEWLRAEDVDTIALTGYMTNNCVVASAAAAEPYGVIVEVRSDATGPSRCRTTPGSASASQVHETVMSLLSSNWAAVATTDAWIDAVRAGADLPRSNLAESAMAGRSVG